MLEGTKKWFPNGYEDFTNAMVAAYKNGELPIRLELEGIKDYTLKDCQDMFSDFIRDTGLNMDALLMLNNGCRELHMILTIDCLKRDETRMLQ